MRNEFGASWNAGELFGNDGNAIENTLPGGHGSAFDRLGVK